MFHESTHKRFWLISVDELLRRRTAAHAKHVAGLSVGLGSTAPSHVQSAQAAVQMSLEEEQILKTYYTQQMVKMCQHVRPSAVGNVASHAVAYLQRHFLNHSITLFPPRSLQLVALVLACKANEIDIPIAEQARVTNCSAEDKALFRPLELRFLQSFHFHIGVHTAFRALRGQIFSLRSSSPSADIAWSDLAARAEALLLTLITTDAQLHCTPSRIALAALKAAAQLHGCGPAIDAHVESIAGSAPGSSLRAELAALRTMMDAPAPVDAAVIGVRLYYIHISIYSV